MSSTIDYSNYSIEELLQAQEAINRDAFPDRAAEIDARIEALVKASPESNENQVIREANVNFTGKAGEFFSIWIVNLLLSIVTLGIYSAWAKVRTHRYFYGNTEIDGHHFSYLADPIAILKGRIIAAILFGAYFATSALYPVVSLVLLLIIFILTPFLVVLSLRFNMKMTAYRNVRFSFRGNFGDAFVYFVLLPFASVFTLYLLMPFALKKMDEFLVDEMNFGNAKFRSDLSAGSYYIAAIGATFLAFAIFGVGIAGLGSYISFGEQQAASPLATVVFMALYLVVFAVSSSFYTYKIRNHIYNTSSLPNVATFSSDVNFGDLLILRVTNLLAIVFSLGLAIPWVKVRTAQFFADATKVQIMAGADDVVAGENGDTNAIAEEASTLFDVDVALG